VAGSPTNDLGRPRLNAARLSRALVQPGGRWTRIVVVPSTGSTNADVIELAKRGEPEGYVLAAEQQNAGRGRLGRVWQSPPRGGLAVSALLRPSRPISRYGWLPLLVGVALAEAVVEVSRLDARLKWPNDLLLDDRKVGGVLVEAVPSDAGSPAVVVGFGINVTLRPAELPVPQATSLAIAGAASTDRERLLGEVLGRLAMWYGRWLDGDDAELRTAYRDRCATLGRPVRVHLPGDQMLAGVADDIDAGGRLIVLTGAGAQPVAAGDVVHVRPAPDPATSDG
jgi:BirA family biotin operon repressor/biotin-[acetyl-CoA-carboxylase] ligase